MDKNEIIQQIVTLLSQLADNKNEAAEKPVEMLTIKECTEVVSGLSEHTVRQLVAQNKVAHIRTGQGKRGKILVNKSDLVSYFQR